MARRSVVEECPYEAEAEYRFGKLLAGDADACFEVRLCFSPSLGRYSVQFYDGDREWPVGFTSRDDGVKVLASLMRAIRRDDRAFRSVRSAVEVV